MSETREPTYLVLDWDEDFKLDAHVDADGQQRFIVSGYIQKRRADGLYQAPIIPELFFGANGQQLDTWSQYLTAGDHTILRRDGGNPSVPEHELNWIKVSGQAPRRTPPTAPVTPTRVTTQEVTLPWFLYFVAVGVGFVVVSLWLFNRDDKKSR